MGGGPYDEGPYCAEYLDLLHNWSIAISNCGQSECDRTTVCWIDADHLECRPMSQLEELPRRISLAPASDAGVRRCTRLLLMVHELHKAGYQRLRIHPGLSGSGMDWRCNITYAGNVEADGFSIRNFDIDEGLVAPFTSASSETPFGWQDGSALSARKMAMRFIGAFPIIVRRSVGRDWPYAGWLTDVLGRAEQGRWQDFLVLYADFPLDRDVLSSWSPPPPPAD